jgi:hypothetical protein
VEHPTQREMEDNVLTRAAALDPNDRSAEAESVRDVAGSIRDHRAMEQRRAEWAEEDRRAAEQRNESADEF